MQVNLLQNSFIMQKRIILTIAGLILMCLEMVTNHLEKAKKNNEYADSIEKAVVNCYSLVREIIPSGNISHLMSLPKMSYLNRFC